VEGTIEPAGLINVRPVALDEKEARATATEATNNIKNELSVWQGYASTLGKVANLTLLKSDEPKPARSAGKPLNWCQIFVEAPPGFDFEKQKAELTRQQTKEQAQLQRDQQRLENPEFMAKAPEEERLKISLRKEESVDRIAGIQNEIISLQTFNDRTN
jgi:valyl-tRNA synthetase